MSKRPRQLLVRRLEEASVIRTAAVREAFLKIPRETFIPEVAKRLGLEAVYRDEAYPTKTDLRGDAISSSSQPGIMASMLEELRVSPGQRVLEIGAGTGYNAALLSALVGSNGRVTSIELDPELARKARRAVRAAGRRANIVAGDGRKGWKANAPYDRVIVTASSLDVPHAWLKQLREGGVLVMPLRLTDAVPFRQIVVAFERVGRRLTSISVVHGGFMRIRDGSDDPSLPWPMSRVVESDDRAEETVASLSGSTWGAFSADEQHRLLALLLSPPRSRPIGIRASRWRQWDLEVFIVLAAPETSLVACTRRDLRQLLFSGTPMPAIVDPSGPSLAHLAGSKTVSRLDAYGSDRAEDLLADLIADWRRRGGPNIARLNIEVSYDHPRRTAWRTVQRGGSRISCDWS
jgi:protein-L-isoaspartate(D-aspartate) O-methyltransferase